MSLLSSIQNAAPSFLQQTQAIEDARARLQAARPQGLGQTGETPFVENLRRVEQVGAAGANTIHGVEKSASFTDLVKGLVQSVDAKQKASAEETRKVLTGESDNIHQAVIAGQEASVAFSLMVETRNKLVEAYQEIMRMQV